MKFLRIIILLCMMLVAGCTDKNSVDPQYLFSLPLGVLPGEFRGWGQGGNISPETAFSVRNGIFYIGDNNRLMSFSSKGLMLDYIAPLSSVADYSTWNEYAGDGIPYYAYSINKIGAIAVDSRGSIIFSNILSQEAVSIINTSNGVNADKTSAKGIVQLLVYQDGEIKYNFGRTGEKGFNFLSISAIYVLADDSVVVISKEEKSDVAYFFDTDGRMIRKYMLPYNQYPRAATDESEGALGLITKVVPSSYHPHLYIQVQRYDVKKEEHTNALLEINRSSTQIYRIDIETGAYIDYITIPKDYDMDDIQSIAITKSEELIFLHYKIDEQDIAAMYPTVFKVNQKGVVTKQYDLKLPQITFLKFNIAIDPYGGGVGGYFLMENELRLYWWNTGHIF